MTFLTSANSSRIFLASRRARRRSCSSRIAVACRSESEKRDIRFVARDVGALRLADRLDDLVQVVEGDLQALQDVRARLGLGQLELRAPRHDLEAEVQSNAAASP